MESHGAAVDALSLAKKTALHLAAEAGQMEVCSTLLKMGADANATDEVSFYCYIIGRLFYVLNAAYKRN